MNSIRKSSDSSVAPGSLVSETPGSARKRISRALVVSFDGEPNSIKRLSVADGANGEIKNALTLASADAMETGGEAAFASPSATTPSSRASLSESDLAGIDAGIKVQTKLYHWTPEEAASRRERAVASAIQDRIEHPDPLEGLL